jgi:high-affinity iron transporter
MDAFIVTLREGFEAALIVGLILAFLAKTGRSESHARQVWAGTLAAAGTSVLLGATLFLAVGELEGTAEKLYEGTAMIAAACVLTWMVFWMRKQSKTIGGHLRSQVSDALQAGSAFALAGVAFVAVAREGIETALFLFAAVEKSGAITTLVGGSLGLLASAALGVLFYRGAIRIDLRQFFTVTGLLVIGLAAYLLFGGTHELAEAGAGEAFEIAAPITALLYGGAFAWLFLRDLRPRRAEAQARP